MACIGSTLSNAHAAAATPTLALTPAAADEVSASIAHLFSRYAEDYHVLAGRAAAFHEHFAQHLTAGAGSYAATEAVNAAQVAPWQQSLRNLSSKLAAVLGRSPVTPYLVGDPYLLSQTSSHVPITRTSLSDPNENFESISWSISILLTLTVSSGFDATAEIGTPGQTLIHWSPLRQALIELNELGGPPPVFHPPTISFPSRPIKGDPMARLFRALLPLGF